MDMNQYLDIFMEESKEHLQNMNEILMVLENTPNNTDLLNEIFRIAHTLKGMSGTMGFNNILNLTHEMENVLDDIRQGKMDINENVIDILFECFDELEKYIYKIEKDNNEGENTSQLLIKKLREIINGPLSEHEENLESINLEPKVVDKLIIIDPHVEKAINMAIEKNLNPFLIKISLDKKCMLKSARAYIVINTLEKLSEIIQSTPSIEDIEDEKFEFDFELIIISEHNKDIIEKNIEAISEIESVDIIDLRQIAYDVIDSHKNNLIVEESEKNEEVKKEKKSDNVDNIMNMKTRTTKTVRVDIDRLDNLMNLVSELIIIKTRLDDIDNYHQKQDINETTEHLERITTSLHDAVMKVRMVPIERVFNRFPRMVRDLSKELNKEISLIMTGAETEVDRTVIDEIGDPLIHLLRNSIDHGIEDINTRIRSHKDKMGVVKLTAYPDGNSVVIEVEDDGKGIDTESIRRKAIEKNIISLQQAQLMEDNEIIQLLFNPGFSTKDEISDISGRGVGLDVVKNKIETLGGTVEVYSTLDKGSRFVIRLPLTLAIIQALLVTTGDEIYAIPLNNIQEISTIKTEDIRSIHDREVILFRNNTLPILRLADLLNAPTIIDEEESTIVIVKKGDKSVGIIVDSLIGQQEIVIKSLGKYLANIRGIAGATILGNGSVALIIDTNSFF